MRKASSGTAKSSCFPASVSGKPRSMLSISFLVQRWRGVGSGGSKSIRVECAVPALFADRLELGEDRSVCVDCADLVLFADRLEPPITAVEEALVARSARRTARADCLQSVNCMDAQ